MKIKAKNNHKEEYQKNQLTLALGMGHTVVKCTVNSLYINMHLKKGYISVQRLGKDKRSAQGSQ